MSEAAATRRPRADAQRNRERIIEAAVEAFQQEGLDVSVAEIARRAGVGSGTLFRNFPTKDDLIRAIVEMHLDMWTEVIAQALEADDTAAAFDDYFAQTVQFNYENRGMLEAFKEGVIDAPELHECKARALTRSDELFAAAKKAGALRDDIVTDDLYALAAGAAESARVVVREGLESPEAAQARYVKIMLAGMRP
ncbi:MAG: helix-turn-helix domain-containing protein [Solirubrobacterales bacterium]